MSENIFKIVVVGASGVGKTKLLTNFADYIYKESTREDTIISSLTPDPLRQSLIKILNPDAKGVSWALAIRVTRPSLFESFLR